MRELLAELQLQDGYLVSPAYGLSKDYFYVLCPYGIGDTLYVSMMMRSYCLYHGITLPICYITKENHANIPAWFDCVDSLIASNDLVTVMNEDITFVREMIEGVPINNPRILDMQDMMDEKYSKEKWESLTADTKLFKLSYKKKWMKQTIVGETTIYGSVLEMVPESNWGE